MREPATYLEKDAMEWTRILEHDDPVLRRLAAQAAVPALRAALSGSGQLGARLGRGSLCKRTGEHSAITQLVAEMREPQAFVRSLAAWHLGRLRGDFPGIEAGIDAIQQLVEDSNPSVRAEAYVALQALQCKGSLPSGTAFLSSQKSTAR
jgi:hypothetical protein